MLRDALPVGALLALEHALGGLGDDVGAKPPHHLDARLGAPVDRVLHQRHERALRHEQRQRDQRHPRLQVDQIGEDADQYAAMQHRLRHAGRDEEADRVGFGQDDRDADAFLGGGVGLGVAQRRGEGVEAQAPARRLADRVAIDVPGELGERPAPAR